MIYRERKEQAKKRISISEWKRQHPGHKKALNKKLRKRYNNNAKDRPVCHRDRTQQFRWLFYYLTRNKHITWKKAEGEWGRVAGYTKTEGSKFFESFYDMFDSFIGRNAYWHAANRAGLLNSYEHFKKQSPMPEIQHPNSTVAPTPSVPHDSIQTESMPTSMPVSDSIQSITTVPQPVHKSDAEPKFYPPPGYVVPLTPVPASMPVPHSIQPIATVPQPVHESGPEPTFYPPPGYVVPPPTPVQVAPYSIPTVDQNLPIPVPVTSQCTDLIPPITPYCYETTVPQPVHGAEPEPKFYPPPGYVVPPLNSIPTVAQNPPIPVLVTSQCTGVSYSNNYTTEEDWGDGDYKARPGPDEDWEDGQENDGYTGYNAFYKWTYYHDQPPESLVQYENILVGDSHVLYLDIGKFPRTLKFLCFTQNELNLGLSKFPYSPRNFGLYINVGINGLVNMEGRELIHGRNDLEDHVEQFNASIDDILHKLPNARIVVGLPFFRFNKDIVSEYNQMLENKLNDRINEKQNLRYIKYDWVNSQFRDNKHLKYGKRGYDRMANMILSYL